MELDSGEIGLMEFVGEDKREDWLSERFSGAGTPPGNCQTMI